MESDWQILFPTIKERALYLLESKNFSDCNFLVGTEPETRLFAAHKMVLSMASAVFERMFYGNLPEQGDSIPIPDVQPDIFDSMMKYIYTDNVNISSLDEAFELYYAAEKYMLPHLVKSCSSYISKSLNCSNACRAYELGELFNDADLLRSSMKTIKEQTKQVLLDKSFGDIKMSTFLTILDEKSLNISSELDLFNALVKYLEKRGLFKEGVGFCGSENTLNVSTKLLQKEEKIQCDSADDVHNNHDDSNNIAGAEPVSKTDCKDEAINFFGNSSDVIDEQMVRKAVKKIRFLSLTPFEFGSGPARSKLLEDKETGYYDDVFCHDFPLSHLKFGLETNWFRPFAFSGVLLHVQNFQY